MVDLGRTKPSHEARVSSPPVFAFPRSPYPSVAGESSPVHRRRHRAVRPAVLPAWAGLEAGWLGGLPGLAPVWAGQEAGALWSVTGLVPGLGRPVGRLSRIRGRPGNRPGPTCGPARTVKSVKF